jgi:hypothetical protein
VRAPLSVALLRAFNALRAKASQPIDGASGGAPRDCAQERRR